MSTFSDVATSILIGAPGEHSVDTEAAPAEFVCDFTSPHPVGVKSAHCIHILLRKGCVMIFYSTYRWSWPTPVLASLGNHVLNIFHLRSLEKMYGAIALFVVAAVQDIQAILNWTIRDFKRLTMNKEPSLSIFKYLSVAVRKEREWPFETRVSAPRQRCIIRKPQYRSVQEIDMTKEPLVMVRVKAFSLPAKRRDPSLAKNGLMKIFKCKPLCGVALAIMLNGSESTTVDGERENQTRQFGPCAKRHLWEIRKFLKYVRSVNLGTAHLSALHWLLGARPRRCFSSAGPLLFYREVCA